MVLRNLSCAAGATCTLSQRQIAVHASAMPASGTDTRVTVTPLARTAFQGPMTLAAVDLKVTAGKLSLLNGLSVTLRSYAVSSSMYDVAIIGGGPAGSTAAALLARAGRRVVLFEREKFPRFHIGESLLPFSMKAFTRLGLHEKFLSAGFIKKYGGEIMGACSDTGTKFYFKDGYRSQTDHAYQVTRSDFDKVLLDHAAESGAEVHEQTPVEAVAFSNGRVDLSVRSNGSA